MLVKDMTDQQLNLQLEILLGAKEDRHRKGNVIKGTYSVSPKDHCNDPAASLEVQAKALEIDTDTYIRHLGAIICDRAADHYKNNSIAKLLSASPRQRAEAAYMTLSSQDLHPLREDI
ncbi:hypothetical protein [Paenibacillus polymyxa]|uniref:hypothetical protein n=1 Tax=Paenibacillus polymyxa TaxID=1406 RepID=UPI00237850CA|nr:hypothetical protein [Paenibacillus polymyxa]WDM22618.1 hypothetical protein J4I02_03075 [Paenibacillus polymyxa]